ncbi:MAG: efflux RND transporter permease subunit [Planctomycetes bacterium]|nr:efflux RND transporter permease subunit [Planctomycetota bacterium]
MKIAETCIRRPVLASMMILALVVFGLVSYRAIGVDLFPDVDIPVVTVTVPFPGADPETVETEVTDRVEEAVNTISGIKMLRSESIEGLSQVFIEFELEVDVDVASQDVRDKVAAIRGELPPDVDPPIVEKFDIDSAPILAIVLSGPVSIRELSEFADNQLKPRIENVDGVGNVRLVGKREREIRVWMRADRLRALGLTAEDVIEALDTENIEMPGGRVETRDREVTVKTKGKVERVEQFGDIIVTRRSGAPIRVRDLAWIEDGMEDLRSLARLDGTQAVSILVRRQSGTNMLRVAQAVKSRIDEVRPMLPGSYRLAIAQDLSVFVEQSIDEAEGELLRGGVLAVLVILFFLRSLRGAFVAAMTIPTTIIATYSFMLGMGFSVNMLTMLALTISVGMIVDDSIVVLENSYRHMEEGLPRLQAAIRGISEIGFAVIATSLAIGAVFVPVAFMDGIVGQFFYEFGLTVAFAVVVSTFIALTLSPMLCSRVLKIHGRHGRVFQAVERGLEFIERVYGWTLRTALRHRFAVVVAALVAFVSSLAITGFLGREFMPNQDESQFNIQVETPIGTSIHATSEVLREIEQRVRQLPGVLDTFTTIGAGVEERVNVATVLTRLVPGPERRQSQAEIMQSTRDVLVDLRHLRISVEVIPRVAGGGFRVAPLQYSIQGPDLDQLAEYSERFMAEMARLPGIVDVNSTYDAGKPEANVVIDREKASDLGVHVKDIGRAVHALIGGLRATVFEQGGETYDVRLRYAEPDRAHSGKVLRVPVRTASGALVDLDNLVHIEPGTGPVQISREDRSRQVLVLANLESFKPLNEAMQDLAAIETRLGLPPGVRTRFVGDAEMMEESFANINFSLLLAVILIYMVLAAQFESLVHPFTIMLSLPLSVVGALGLLALTGRSLNIFSMIGMIMLMGLVTKNAILLIDYTNLLRGRGMSRNEAVLRAGPVRLRPILMTAFSTIAGMLPVAIGLGSGAETRAPMGTAIVGGMLTSTVLTLVVVPVVYTIMDDLGLFAHRWLFGEKPDTALEADASAALTWENGDRESSPDPRVEAANVCICFPGAGPAELEHTAYDVAGQVADGDRHVESTAANEPP